MVRHLYQAFSTLSIIAYSCIVRSGLARTRTVGPANDHKFLKASKACDGNNPKNFEFGMCSRLISCIYENLGEALKASLSSGTNIASLLPTILILIGELSFLIIVP